MTSFRFVEPVVLMMLLLGLCGSRIGGIGPGTIDDLVESAAIDPHTPASGTVVDLDSLAVGHHELDVANWAVHAIPHRNREAMRPSSGAGRYTKGVPGERCLKPV